MILMSDKHLMWGHTWSYAPKPRIHIENYGKSLSVLKIAEVIRGV